MARIDLTGPSGEDEAWRPGAGGLRKKLDEGILRTMLKHPVIYHPEEANGSKGSSFQGMKRGAWLNYDSHILQCYDCKDTMAVVRLKSPRSVLENRTACTREEVEVLRRKTSSAKLRLQLARRSGTNTPSLQCRFPLGNRQDRAPTQAISAGRAASRC
jgi:hypothetical protein